MKFCHQILDKFFTEDELTLIITKETEYNGFESNREDTVVLGHCKIDEANDGIRFQWNQQNFWRQTPKQPDDMSSPPVACGFADMLNSLSGNATYSLTCDMMESLYDSILELNTLTALTMRVEEMHSLTRDIANELGVPDMAIEQQLIAVGRSADADCLESGKVMFDGIEHLQTVRAFTQLWDDSRICVERPQHLVVVGAFDENKALVGGRKVSFYGKLFCKR